MKKVIPLILLGIAACVALLILVFGVDEIIFLLPKFSDPLDMRLEIYARIIFILLGIIFVVLLLERLNIFNEFEYAKSNADKIDAKVYSLSGEISDIKQTIAHLNSKLVPFFQRFENHNHQRFYELLWKYMFRGDGSLDDSETLSVGSKTSIFLWRDCISESKSWEAISYAKNLWQNAEQEISKAHQDVHVKLGGIIYRVFVFDTEDERNDFQHDEKKQDILSSGDIRWVLKSNLINKVNERLRMDLDSAGLMDFAISDVNKYVLWFRGRLEIHSRRDIMIGLCTGMRQTRYYDGILNRLDR